MKKSSVLAMLAFGILAVTAEISVAQSPYAARWYPFYGYRRPAYLASPSVVTASASPSVVTVQPSAATVQSGPQVYSTNYRPPESTVAAPAPAVQGGPHAYSSNYWASEPTVPAPASGWSRTPTGGQWYPFYGYRRPAYLSR